MQSHGGDAVTFLFAGIMGFFCCGLVVGLAIQALVCYLVIKLFNALPPQHRKQKPELVWLLMIPLFPLVWNFFVFPKLSESYASYFASINNTMEGDCNRSLALAYCILTACAIVPYAGALAALAGLVVLIIYLVKMYDLKKKVEGI